MIGQTIRMRILAERFGDESLRITLLLGLSISIWSVVHYFLASKTLSADMARAKGGQL